MAIRVAINGFGRIGRAFARLAHGRGIELVAVNDLGSAANLAYLLKHDTVYGPAPFKVEIRGEQFLIDGKEVSFFAEKDPSKLPWKTLRVDVVVESTGFFTDYDAAKVHLDAGARRVVITAPAQDSAVEGLGATVLMGLNEERLAACKISSNASCTTNSASPVIAILDEAIGIEKAVLSTTHAYTASQSVVDGPSRKEDMREGRAAAQNIVPTSTGAARAVAQAYAPLAGKFDGISLRVPVVAGSIADITFIAKRTTTREEVNEILRAAALAPRWEGIFKTTDEELVSSDIIGDPYASIADLSMTRVVDGTLVKVLSWYDNEMGYTESLVRHVIAAANA